MRSFIGKVVSDRMQKSVVVAVDRLFQHPKYPRTVKRTKKFMVRAARAQRRRMDTCTARACPLCVCSADEHDAVTMIRFTPRGANRALTFIGRFRHL